MVLNWKEVSIGEIGKIVTGNTPSKKNSSYFGGQYTWIKPTDITIGHRYVSKTEETYSELAFKKYENCLLPPLSTCVVTIGTVGEKICLAREPSFTNQSINAVIPKEGEYDPLFVYYLLKQSLPKVAKRNPGTASGRHHVSKSNFSSIVVRVPPYPMQKKISAILSPFDDSIEINQRKIEILEKVSELIFAEWFVHFKYPGHENTETVSTRYGSIPKGWKYQPFGEIAENYDCKRIPLSSMERSKRKGIYPYYGAAKILDFVDDYIFDGRYLLIAEDGSVITPEGYPVLQLVDCKFWVNNHTHVVQARSPLSTNYLYLCLRNFQILGYVTGAAQPKINQTNLNRIPILVPSNEILSAFDNYIEDIFRLIRICEKRNEVLMQARDLLIPPLVSGEYDICGLNTVAFGD